MFHDYLPLNKFKIPNTAITWLEYCRYGVKHNSINQFPNNSPEEPLCHVWIKLAQWFWKRRSLYCFLVFDIIYIWRRASWVRVLAQQAEGWYSNPSRDKPKSSKTGSDSSTAKRSAIGVSVTGPRRWPLRTDAPCHSRCGTIKDPQCSMAMSAGIGQNVQPFTGNGGLHMSEKFSSGTINPKQTNKQKF